MKSIGILHKNMVAECYCFGHIVLEFPGGSPKGDIQRFKIEI